MNPVDLGTGGTYQHVWTTNNDHIGLYATFDMDARGYATISSTKPIDSEGEVCGYEIYIYDAYGEKVWDCDTKAQEPLPTAKFTYNVGLDVGSYTLHFKPGFYVSSGNIDCTLAVKTRANNFWEIESNNEFSKATLLKLNKKYTAVYGENIESQEGDYFKFKLKKGKRYVISLGNYSKLFAGTTIIKLYDANKKYVDSLGDLEETGKQTIKAGKTGYYYIKFYNEFREGVQFTIKVKQKK